jgi:hypothetical protein
MNNFEEVPVMSPLLNLVLSENTGRMLPATKRVGRLRERGGNAVSILLVFAAKILETFPSYKSIKYCVESKYTYSYVQHDAEQMQKVS